MTPRPFRVAVIADPHLHDPASDFGQGAGPFLRPASDVVKSLRVFNETAAALRHALRDIVARGIRHVVLLGDLTDDGQRAALEALQRLLDEARGWGLTFWAVPGNHDVFADTGRHRTRRIVNPDAGYDLFTSNPDRRDPLATRRVVTPRMRCLGMPEGLLPGLGFFRGSGDLHWETPFGMQDDPGARRYGMRSSDGTVERFLMDASYLVEPEPGVWLLMIDANVWVPHGQTRPAGEDDYVDSTDAGWRAMLQHKRFVLDWMAGVVTRARLQGKRLMTFSHYPVLNPFAASRAAERALLGATPLARRLPGVDVARAVAATGIGVHFSGHLHLNDTSRFSEGAWPLVNVAVPSLAAFPAAYKIVTLGETVQVQTVDIGAMPMPDNVPYPGRLAGHASYGGFLASHAGNLVARRHLRREWPETLAAQVPGLTLGEMTGGEGGDTPALAVIEDFYRVRMGGSFGTDLIPPDRLAIYRAAIGVNGPWAPLFAMLNHDLNRLPDRDFSIDPATGAVTAV